VPQVVSGPDQREIQLVSQEPDALFEDVGGVKIFQLRDLAPGQSYAVTQNVMFDSYSIQTRVNPANLPRGYDTSTRLYKKYTAADFVVISNHPRIKQLAQSILKNTRIPYNQAQAVYNWILERLQPTEGSGEADILQAVDARKGGSYAYAVLFCALTRAAGIPSRPVAGYVIDAGRRAFRHYWAEFYVEGIGWIPVDPLLGEGSLRVGYPGTDFRPQEYYFGNLDAGHAAFSRGVILLNPMKPEGRAIRRSDVPSLQSIHEEAAGNLFGYSAAWSDLQILGVY
jgi:transglutaminase-like putative cysteine protease